MGSFTISEHLTTGTYRVNLSEVIGTMGGHLECEIDREAEYLITHAAEETGLDVPEDLAFNLERESYDVFHELFDKFSEIVTGCADDLLTCFVDSESVEPPIELTFVEASPMIVTNWGYGEDITVDVTIRDTDELRECLIYEGLDVSTDGHGVPGFVRTAEDSQWAVTCLLRAVFDDWRRAEELSLTVQDSINELVCQTDLGNELYNWVEDNRH